MKLDLLLLLPPEGYDSFSASLSGSLPVSQTASSLEETRMVLEKINSSVFIGLVPTPSHLFLCFLRSSGFRIEKNNNFQRKEHDDDDVVETVLRARYKKKNGKKSCFTNKIF